MFYFIKTLTRFSFYDQKALPLRLLRPELVKGEKINQGLLESVWAQWGEY